MIKYLNPAEADTLYDDDAARWVDIRDPASFAAGHIDRAVALDSFYVVLGTSWLIAASTKWSHQSMQGGRYEKLIASNDQTQQGFHYSTTSWYNPLL